MRVARIVLAAFVCGCSGGTHLAGDRDGEDDSATGSDDVATDDALDTSEIGPDPGSDDAAADDARDVPTDTVLPECTIDPAIAAPGPVAPANGTTTGSPWAPDGAMTLRPLFRWREGGDPAATVEIQVDDSCSTPGFAECRFPSPEATGGGTFLETTWRPEADLPIERFAPVGRRYYWRLRARVGESCSAWSPVRYVDVGRAPDDWNGDGYSDLAIGAPGWAHAFVYLGGATPDAVPDATYVGAADDTYLGDSTAWLGDVNADGFGDLLVAGMSAGGTGRGYLLLGGAAPDIVPDLVLEGAGHGADFGRAAAGGADVNGDGYADYLIGSHAGTVCCSTPGRADLFFGGSPPDGASDLALGAGIGGDLFGVSVALGDLDGDGFGDLLVGASGYDSFGAGPGALYVYPGGPALDGIAHVRLDGEARGDGFGSAVAVADLDGDGFDDLVVGAPDAPDGSAGRVYFWFGGELPRGSADVLHTGRVTEGLGQPLSAGGDFNGDGYADVAVGAVGALWIDPAGVGAFSVVLGGGDFAGIPIARLEGTEPGDRIGVALAMRGDFNGDGLAELVAGEPTWEARPGNAYLWFGQPEVSLTRSDADLSFTGTMAGDSFGAAVACLEPSAWASLRVARR